MAFIAIRDFNVEITTLVMDIQALTYYFRIQASCSSIYFITASANLMMDANN